MYSKTQKKKNIVKIQRDNMIDIKTNPLFLKKKKRFSEWSKKLNSDVCSL